MGGGVKPRGRPREFDQVVSVRLPATLHDALIRVAVERRVDVSDVIRCHLSNAVGRVPMPAPPAKR